MPKEYDFTIHLSGIGDTPEEAWEDVCRKVNFGTCEDDWEMPRTYKIVDQWDD